MTDFRKYILNPLGMLVIFAAVFLASMIFMVIKIGDAQKNNLHINSYYEFNKITEWQLEQLARQVRDYSNWNEAITNILLKPNPTWWKQNSGDYSVSTFNLDISVALSGNNKVIFRSSSSNDALDITQSRSFNSLLASSRKKLLSTDFKKSVTTGFVQHKGKIYYLGIARFEDTELHTPVPDKDAVLIFGKEAQAKSGPLSEVEKIIGGSKIIIKNNPSKELINFQYPLTGEDKNFYAQWSPKDYGTSLTNRMIPAIILTILSLGVLVWYAIKKASDLTNKIKKDKAIYSELYIRNNQILDASSDGIIGVDANGEVTFLNASAVKLYGKPEDEIKKCIFENIHYGENPSEENIYLLVGKTLKDGMERSKSREKFQTTEQQERFISYSVSAITKENIVTGAVITLRDVTQLHAAEEEMRYRAHYDTLTGLTNRETFSDRVKNELLWRKGNEIPFHMAVLDLDDFKKINDTLGHQWGDNILKAIAARLQNCVRPFDTVARLGGDEFAIIFAKDCSVTSIEKICADIISEICRPIVIEEKKFWMSASIGLAAFPKDGTTIKELLRNADIAMYHAKENGGKRFHTFDEKLLIEKNRAQRIERELHEAVLKNEFTMFYQPIYELKSGSFSHFEALLRWKNKNLGDVSPSEFIPIAEDTGIIANLGKWAFEECCRQIYSWSQQGIDAGVAINISVRQIPHGLTASDIAELLSRYKIKPGRVKLEITETTLMDHSKDIEGWINAVHALGLEIALDDFGTGYSSLAYLKKYKLQTIKIDKSFIADIAKNSDDQKLVMAIISMAKGLNMPVVAEGVEDAEQAAWLEKNNCTMVQGYFYGKPSPADEALNTVMSKSH